MTQAEKIANVFCGQYEQYEGSIVNPRGCITKIPEDDIIDFIKQVAERGIEEAWKATTQVQSHTVMNVKKAIISNRWWEEEVER